MADTKINKDQALKALVHRRADKDQAPKELLRQLNAKERESIALDNGAAIIGEDRHYMLRGKEGDAHSASDIMRTVMTDFRKKSSMPQ